MFPPPLNDDELVIKLLEDGFRLAPDSPYGHHVAAQFYERRKKVGLLFHTCPYFVSRVDFVTSQDINKAKYHLQISANHKNFGAAVDLLRLEYDCGDLTKPEAVSRLEKFCEEYVEPPRLCQSLAQLTSYYIFERQDIFKAFDCFRKLLLIDPNDLNMLVRKLRRSCLVSNYVVF